ncbi:MAG: Hpt domain-containing protein, partial [Gammaproteobacteria bacterium]|nr:Hpt domain-containing protein [Gammaproteobacteria bacterium]
MGNHHDSIALDWVRGEIQETLKQAQFALESSVDNREDTSRLRFCLNYLHQVHGTLQMVELYGAALLTEEMEHLAQALLGGKLSAQHDADAIEVLMESILQLPRYLESVQSAQDDRPVGLLPLLNDLRAARGEGLLSDTSLFNPDLSPARFKPRPSVNQRLQDANVLGHLRKLRQMFQFGVSGVSREIDLDTHFDYLDKVIQRLLKVSQQTPTGELWLVASAFVDTLRARRNPVTAATKTLLRELDLQLRRLLEEHVDILSREAPETLLKHLLYYVARVADIDTPTVRTVRDRYRLQTLLTADSRDLSGGTGPGRDAIHSVVSALNEELAKIKDQLDLFVRAEYRRNSDLEDLLPGLQQIANTLAVLSLGIPRKVINEQAELIERLARQPDTIDDGTLMDIAGSLLYVEATLSGLNDSRKGSVAGTPADMAEQQLNQANNALLREARNALEQVKTAIVNFIASQWDV